MDPAKITAELQKGNISAFEEVISEYQGVIIRYLYRLTNDYNIALDLAQDTFIQAYKNILKTGDDLNLRAWIYKIATNNARQYLRRKKIVSFIPFEKLKRKDISENGHHPRDTAEELSVKETLLKLPHQQRTCLILHYIEGFKYREIAETLGISEEAVRKRIARGKQSFRTTYDGGYNK